jgi:hypothetical protein
MFKPRKPARALFSALLLGAGGIANAYELQVLNAIVKDKAIEGAEVILQKAGEQSLKGVTNAKGMVAFDKPFGGDDADALLIVKKPGFSNLVVKCPCDGMTYAISPGMDNLNGLRIVLSWGNTPQDLDSHLYSLDDHVFFDRRNGNDAGLDVDDTDGYGPETITVRNRRPDRKYLYAVHNYTEGDRQGTLSLSLSSRAKVFVYVGSTLVRTFTPPRNKTGNTWVVFGVGENGEFYDINKFADFAGRDQVGGFMDGLVKSGDLASFPEVSTDQKTLADALNQQGEKAYHEKNYAEAERLYLEAIDNNPEHSQAYSNLGLLYQKTGKKAEGLFANSKAVSLGRGNPVVQASSYYNMARIYEDAGDWSQALASYKSAQNLRPQDAYAKGIERMNKKLKGK